MVSKLFSALFKLIPENGMKNQIRAIVHRLRFKEYKTFYRNNVWELHYPNFVLKYKDVPSPATVNYLFFKNFTDRKFETIIDAGGFMGTYGFLMASRYPDAEVYIFEADPVNYQRIKTNLSLNDLPNVIIEKTGLWSKPDKLKMSVGSDLASSVVNSKSTNATVEIDVTSLDEYFKNVKGKIVFLKMNIEGAEIAALKGATNFLANNLVDLCICTDHLVDGEMSYIAVEKILAEFKIPFETLRDGMYINTYASNIRKTYG
jgi:FkbM family methyltransferase